MTKPACPPPMTTVSNRSAFAVHLVLLGPARRGTVGRLRFTAHRRNRPIRDRRGVVRTDHAPAGRRSGETVLEREGRRRRARGDLELREHVLQVPGHGVLADHQLDRDVAIGLPCGDETEDLGLAPGQPARELTPILEERTGPCGPVRRRAARTPRAPPGARARRPPCRPPPDREPVPGTREGGLVGQLQLLPRRARTRRRSNARTSPSPRRARPNRAPSPPRLEERGVGTRRDLADSSRASAAPSRSPASSPSTWAARSTARRVPASAIGQRESERGPRSLDVPVRGRRSASPGCGSNPSPWARAKHSPRPQVAEPPPASPIS